MASSIILVLPIMATFIHFNRGLIVFTAGAGLFFKFDYSIEPVEPGYNVMLIYIRRNWTAFTGLLCLLRVLPGPIFRQISG